ncbi:hypothetical protein Glove_99g131 [Diversispora epigaea]|uniref:Major facilitator superfamily (MFS) profile domain-containing protein n=1 Tax=Diversispora epigaea TaxID=1348612 RepID=A0A397J412_9GLOM|nr:hypothetical protein Glove_99g131 [Diversispora epigaea]
MTLEKPNYEVVIDNVIVEENSGQNVNEIVNINEEESKKNKEKNLPSAMINFYVIASGYLLFTMTDSGLRMIILLELYNRRFNALQISTMFILYEFFGVVTNLVGGILGSRLGLRFCLLVGLCTQVIGIGISCGLQSNWSSLVVILYIVIAQGFSGIAKDMVKLGGKSVTKLVTKEDIGHQSKLFNLVAWLTGAKNSIKGAGFFVGAFLLRFTGYVPSLLVLLGMNLVVIPFAWYYLDKNLAVSKSKEKLTFKEIFNKGRDVNILSLARMFLFGSRDLWFEVPIPLYLRGAIGWSYIGTGAFLAGWVIFYGAVQSSTPKLILKPIKLYPVKHGRLLVPFTISLLIVNLTIAFLFTFIELPNNYTLILVIVLVGLYLFAFLFAINSSIHSFLILAYCHRDKVAMNVGFYYMANAMGRLIGLVIGGLLYWYFGLFACLWASTIALICCTFISIFLGPIPNDELESQ